MANVDDREIELVDLGDNESNDDPCFHESLSDFEDEDREEEFVNDSDDPWKEWSDVPGELIKFPFFCCPGYQPPISDPPTTPLKFFELFFTDDLIDCIVQETNRYGDEKVQKNTPFTKRSIWASWTHVNREEFKAFLGVILNMACNDKPEIQDYFSTNWLDHQPFFGNIFSRERFLQIFWNLHVDGPNRNQPINEETMERDKRDEDIRKIKNLFNYLEQRFREFYIPNRELSVDESTVRFQGRVSFKTYNKNKPAKWGIKIYTLSDSRNGYAYAFEPYFGSKTNQYLIRPDLPPSSRIVVHLVDKYLKSTGNCTGAHVFTDRYFTSPQLALELRNMQIHLTGTVKSNRKGNPESFKVNRTKKMKKDDMISMRNRKIGTVVWKDKNRAVCMLSTYYDNNVQFVSRRTKIDGCWRHCQVRKPFMVCEYNKYMAGVDITDHYATAYSFRRKTSKWWRKMFFWILDVSINNAYQLYRLSAEGKNIRSRQFRRAIIQQLVGDLKYISSSSGKHRESNNSILEPNRLDGRFHAIYSKRGNRDCKVCSDRKSGRRKTTNFYCKSCPGRPGLHPGECFEKYHTKKKFNSNK